MLVGFSGGADSSALLDMLNRECGKRGISLTAVHVNHMIRGQEAERDEEFCKELCGEKGIRFISIKRDIPAIAKERKQGLEECARSIRYEAFESICKEYGIDLIATAHNADDNLETLIFNIVRGCGSSGMSAISPVRGNIIRPLISCTKKEIIEYCSQKGISYVTDSTNSDTEYTRNFIRHLVLPQLRQINCHAEENAFSACEKMREINEFLDHTAGMQNGVFLPELHQALIKRMFANEYAEYAKNSDSAVLSEKNYDDFVSLVKSEKINSFLSLPGKIRVCIDNDHRAVFDKDERKKDRQSGAQCDGKRFYLKKGINLIDELDCVAVLSDHGEDITYKDQNIYNLSIKQTLYFDTITQVERLYIRARIPGDEYRYGGMTRKIKKLLTPLHLTGDEKASYPVVCDENGILYLPGFRQRESVNGMKSQIKLSIQIFMFRKKAFGGEND